LTHGSVTSPHKVQQDINRTGRAFEICVNGGQAVRDRHRKIPSQAGSVCGRAWGGLQASNQRGRSEHLVDQVAGTGPPSLPREGVRWELLQQHTTAAPPAAEAPANSTKVPAAAAPVSTAAHSNNLHIILPCLKTIRSLRRWSFRRFWASACASSSLRRDERASSTAAANAQPAVDPFWSLRGKMEEQ
jgi:hypothetical protein